MSDDGDSEVSLDDYEWSHSLDYYRIRWRIQEGPIWENIHVLDDPGDANSAQKPFQDENGNLHEVASRPLSDTEDLTKFVVHYTYDNAAYERLPRLYFRVPEGQESFTIGDYVLRAHPWLVQNRDDILKELLATQDEPAHKSWPADVEIWVQTTHPQFHGIQLLNSAVDDIDASWAVAATEAQDKRYGQKRERRERARIPPGQEEPKASLAFHRLRWEMREGGSIRECVRVINNVLELDSEEKEPFQAESGEFHEIADLPATVVPTSRLLVLP